jgi:CubicO group peptidase (beta-lactamase class C family)
VCNDLSDAALDPPPIAPDKLAHFREVAEQNLTDALVVVKDGHVVLRWQRPGTKPRFEAMSVTKSIASLVIGQLVDAGRLHLDDKLSLFFDAWAGDPRGDITLRQVLEHTTGLADEKTTEAIYANGDFVAFALAAKLEHPPGTRFFYSNKASNLLSGIVRKVTGRELAEVAKEGLFAKLGITEAEWYPDKAGHTQVMAGLRATADELARLGELVLNDGVWCGQQVVSRDWIQASTRTFASPGLMGGAHGLFWWLKPTKVEAGFDKELFEDWARTGMPKAFIDKFRPLEGQFFERHAFFLQILKTLTGKADSNDIDRDIDEWYRMTWKAKRRDGATRRTGITSIRADGWLGQYIFVFPEQRLVVVRLRHAPADKSLNEAGSFSGIEKEIDKLISSSP